MPIKDWDEIYIDRNATDPRKGFKTLGSCSDSVRPLCGGIAGRRRHARCGFAIISEMHAGYGEARSKSGVGVAREVVGKAGAGLEGGLARSGAER
jgi:hypothetical protein